MTNPATMPAVTHVAITVTDLEASRQWYTRVLGAEPVLDEDTGPFHHVVYALGNTLLGLHGFPVLTSEEKFDERRPGLDHIAFGVGSREELSGGRPAWTSWASPAATSSTRTTAPGLSFRDPDNIALELFAPPALIFRAGSAPARRGSHTASRHSRLAVDDVGERFAAAQGLRVGDDEGGRPERAAACRVRREDHVRQVPQR